LVYIKFSKLKCTLKQFNKPILLLTFDETGLFWKRIPDTAHYSIWRKITRPQIRGESWSRCQI